MNTRKHILTFGACSALLCSAGNLSGAEQIILRESFETDGHDTRYIVVGGFDDGNDNFIARRQTGSAGTTVYGGTIDGEWMFGFQDLDWASIENRINGDLYESEGMNARQGRIKFENIDVAGFGNLRIEMAAANGGGGNEPNDDFYMRVRFDGGDWIEIGGFKTESSNSRPIHYIGPRDTMMVAGMPDKLFRFFSDWSWPIPATGSTMELQITVEGNAGNEDHYIDNIRLYGDATVGIVTPSFAQGAVTEPETGGIANNVTLTLAAPAPAGGVTFHLEPSDQRSADSLALSATTVTIPEGVSSAEIGVEVIQDFKYTGIKTVDLFVRAEGYSTAFARVLVENVSPRPNVVIMEVLNVVPGLSAEDVFGDANGDGVYHNTRDQFIEIVNFDSVPVDLSGWRLGDDLTDRHLIPEGTVLQPNQALVVFGGGIPRGTFGGAIVQVASGGGNGLGLNISSRAEIAYLNAQFGAPVDFVNIPDQRADHLRIAEDPTFFPAGHAGAGVSASVHRLAKGAGEFAAILAIPTHMHSLIPGAEQRLFSPGTYFDGTPYFDAENEITLTIDQTSIREDAGPNAATGTITLSEAAPAGGFAVTLETDGVVVHSDGSFSPDEIDLDSLVVTVPAGATTTTFRIGAHNDGILDGDRIVSISARAGAYVLSGFAELTVVDVAENNLSVVINEIYADAESNGFDVNLDGIPDDGLGDQFIELVNAGSEMVNLSGWHLTWDTGSTFAVPRPITTFPRGTWVPAGGSIVVFGRISPEKALDPSFGGAIVQPAYTATGQIKPDGVDLQMSTDFDVKLFNQHGFLVNELVQSSLANLYQGSSITRSPDLTGDFVQHLESGSFFTHTPGMTIGNTPFAGNGTVKLPMVFKDVYHSDGQGWFVDPVYGWVYASAGTLDVPFVYVLDLGRYWYVPETSNADGMWVWDYGLNSWVFTASSFYRWAWTVEGTWTVLEPIR